MLRAKLFVISLSIAIIASFSLISHAQAAVDFEDFNINDFHTSGLSQDILVEQIQSFAFRIEKELLLCQSRGEIERQDIFCTNIYEAERLRLSMLLGMNANLNSSAITKRNDIRRVVFGKGAIVNDIGHNNSTTVNQSDLDGEIKNAPKESLLKDSDISQAIPQNNYRFSKATDLALKSCALGIGSYSEQRLIQLNPDVISSTTNAESDNKKYPDIGCEDLLLVVRQFQRQTNIELILQNNAATPWLNFNRQEKRYYELTDAEKRQANQTIVNESDYKNTESKCIYRGLQALLICPPLRAMGGLSQAGLNLIQKRMIFSPKYLDRRSNGGNVLFRVWQEFRNLANIGLVIGTLLIVIAYLANYKLANYQIKKVLPKIISLALMINLSFLLVQVSTDLSNVVGVGLFNFFSGIVGVNPPNIQSIVSNVLAGGLVVGVALIAPILLIPILIFTILSIFMIMIMFAFRDAAFTILTILTPVALISLFLPNTKRLFNIWKNTFWSIILIPPLIGLLFGSSQFVSHILSRKGVLMPILAIIPLAGQFYFLPKILLSSIKNLPLLGNKIASTIGSMADQGTDKYKRSQLHTSSINNFRASHRRLINNPKLLGKIAPTKNAKVNAILNKMRPSVLYYGSSNLAQRAKNKLIGNLPGEGYSSLTNTTNYDDFKNIMEQVNQVDPPVAKAVLVNQLAPLHNALGDTATPGIIANSAKHAFQHPNNLSESQQTTFQAIVRDNNPNSKLACLIKTSQDGDGSVQEITKVINDYIHSGGNTAVLQPLLQELEKNYKKESQIEQAAFLKKVLDSNNFINGITPEPDADNSLAVQTTKEYFVKVNDWNKFKGFKSGSVNDVAFQQFLAHLKSTIGVEATQRHIQLISQQAAKNADAGAYLDQCLRSL